MSNMAHARFRNTASDLRDCYENWDEAEKWDEEVKARQWLLRLCAEIVADFGDPYEED